MAMVGSCSSIPLPTNFPCKAELLNKKFQLDEIFQSSPLKGAVSRNSAKLGNYKMPFKLRET